MPSNAIGPGGNTQIMYQIGINVHGAQATGSDVKKISSSINTFIRTINELEASLVRVNKELATFISHSNRAQQVPQVKALGMTGKHAEQMLLQQAGQAAAVETVSPKIGSTVKILTGSTQDFAKFGAYVKEGGTSEFTSPEAAQDVVKKLGLKQVQLQFQQTYKSIDGTTKAITSFKDVTNDTLSPMDQMRKGVGSLNSKLNLLRWTWVNVFFAMKAAMAGFKIVQWASEIEMNMTKIMVVTGGVGDSARSTMDAIVDLRKGTIFSLAEMSEGFFQFSKTGFSAYETLLAMPAVTSLAAVGFTDLGTSTRIVAQVLHMFNMKASEASRVTDVLAKAANISAANVESLGLALSYAGPMATVAMMSFEETVAAITVLANAGLDGSKSGTALAAMLTKLMNPSDRAKESIERLGMSFFDAEGNMLSMHEIVEQMAVTFEHLTKQEQLEFLTEVFGQRAVRAIALLINEYQEGTTTLYAIEQALDDVGYAQQRLEMIMETATGRMKVAWNALLADISKGSQFIPEAVAKGLEGLSKKLAAGEYKRTQAWFSEQFGESLGGEAGQTIGESIGRMFAVQAGGMPGGMLVDFFSDIDASFKKLSSVITWWKETTVSNFNKVEEAFSPLIEQIEQLKISFGEAVTPVKDFFAPLIELADKSRDKLSPIFDLIEENKHLLFFIGAPAVGMDMLYGGKGDEHRSITRVKGIQSELRTSFELFDQIQEEYSAMGALDLTEVIPGLDITSIEMADRFRETMSRIGDELEAMQTAERLGDDEAIIRHLGNVLLLYQDINREYSQWIEYVSTLRDPIERAELAVSNIKKYYEDLPDDLKDQLDLNEDQLGILREIISEEGLSIDLSKLDKEERKEIAEALERILKLIQDTGREYERQQRLFEGWATTTAMVFKPYAEYEYTKEIKQIADAHEALTEVLMKDPYFKTQSEEYQASVKLVAQVIEDVLGVAIDELLPKYSEWKEQQDAASEALTRLNNQLKPHADKLKEYEDALKDVNSEIAKVSKPRFVGQLEVEKLISDVERYIQAQELAVYGITDAFGWLQDQLKLTQDEYGNLVISIEEVNKVTNTSKDSYEAWRETVEQFIKSIVSSGHQLGINVSDAVTEYQTLLLQTSKFGDETKGTSEYLSLLKKAYDVHYGGMEQDVQNTIAAHEEQSETIYSSSKEVIEVLNDLWNEQDKYYRLIEDKQKIVDGYNADIKKQQTLFDDLQIKIDGVTKEMGELASATIQAMKDINAENFDDIISELDKLIKKYDEAYNASLRVSGGASDEIPATSTDLSSILSGSGSLSNTIDSKFLRSILPTKMAGGGYVDRPTLALIGEAGPEVVIPIEKLDNIGGSHTNVNTSPQPSVIINNLTVSAANLNEQDSFLNWLNKQTNIQSKIK